MTIAIVLAFFANTASFAERTFYGIASGSLNDMVISYDFDALDNTGATKLPHTVVYDLPDVFEDLCGVSVGDYFYAYYNDANNSLCFGTINFSTGTVTKINSFSSTNSPNVQNMTYDAESGEVYGVATGYDDEGKQILNLVKVSLTDGTTTVLKQLTKLTCPSIQSDGNGGFYVIGIKINSSWQYRARVYHIDAAATETEEYADESLSMSGTTFYCSYKDGNNIYYVNGSNLYIYDTAAKTLALAGTLKKGLYALTPTLSTKDAEGAAPSTPVRLLVSKKWYGDIMGTADSNLDMSKTEYFYDLNGRLVRTIESGRTYETYEYEMSAYTRNEFDDNGRLSSAKRYQYGVYDYGDMALNFRSQETYEYDANNNLTKKVTSTYTYSYEYDKDGNCVREVQSNSAGSIIQVLEYSDFAAVNKPKSIKSYSPEHPEWTSYIYVAKREYDENNNLIKESRYTDTGSTIAFHVETWTYTDGMLTLYTKNLYNKTNGALYSQLKTEYEIVDGNPDLVRETTYTASGDDKWAMSGRPCIAEYRTFDGQEENCWMEMGIIPVEGAKNTNKVIFSVPAIAYTNPCRIDLYRNGQVIYSKEVMDIMADMEANGEMFTGSLSYVDKDIPNGEYDYFIQPMIGPMSSIFDETEDEGTESETTTDNYVGYYISPIVKSTLNLELPAATDLRVTNARKNEYNEDILTISWTNPADINDYGFISNDLYFEKMQLPEVDTHSTDTTSLEASFYRNNMNVFVLTRYTYGKAFSDTLAVDVKGVIAGIATVNDNGNEIRFDGNTFSVEGSANLAVYSANGALQTKAANVSSLEMGSLPTGVYLICVEQNGKKEIYKVTVK